MKGRDTMYYQYYENGEHSVSLHFGISTGRYKLIRFYSRVNDCELYDMRKDKSEMKNVYDQKRYEKITAKLKKRLSALIAAYEDEDAKKILQDGDVPNGFQCKQVKRFIILLPVPIR